MGRVERVPPLNLENGGTRSTRPTLQFGPPSCLETNHAKKNLLPFHRNPVWHYHQLAGSGRRAGQDLGGTSRHPHLRIGPPEPNPQFYSGGNSQGAQHRIYPYPAYDNLTTEKVDKSYKMVYLENEYVKIGVLPESGGKIFEAIDKTNGYNFFYHQHVIKPALISLLGAWISGGVEWDLPHHHRATSFLPVQYTIEENPDGSKTVWVGELELRDRMRWAVGSRCIPASRTSRPRSA